MRHLLPDELQVTHTLVKSYSFKFKKIPAQPQIRMNWHLKIIIFLFQEVTLSLFVFVICIVTCDDMVCARQDRMNHGFSCQFLHGYPDSL